MVGWGCGGVERVMGWHGCAGEVGLGWAREGGRVRASGA